MTKPIKIALIVLGILLILFIVGIFVSNSLIKSKVEDLLTNSMPESINVEYDDIDVSAWRGRVSIINPRVSNFASKSGRLNSSLKMDTLIVDDFGYWDYFKNENITISKILIKGPNLTYYHDKPNEEKEYKYSKLEKLKRNISVKKFQISNGKFEVRKRENDSLLLKSQQLDADVSSIRMNSKTVKNRIPFLFDSYTVNLDSLFFNLNIYENLKIGSAAISERQAQFNGLKLYTKYSEQKLNQMISVERDHFDVSIDSLILKQQQFGYEQDSIFYFKVPQIVFYTPEMHLYRNNLIPDDSSIKPMYSKSLRGLNFNLTLNEILLKNATITYAEKVKVENPPGEISFSNMNATIKNLSNTYSESEKTTLDIDAIFMKSSPIHVDWSFDVNNANDHFAFKADIGNLPAQDLNTFTEPNLNVLFEGELLKTYFTIDGNVNQSAVNLRANYDDFKVTVLQKEGKKKNKLLSAIANLFIKNDSDNKPGNFREGNKDEIERDKTKSIFNFLWLNARAGLLSALTGDGEK